MDVLFLHYGMVTERNFSKKICSIKIVADGENKPVNGFHYLIRSIIKCIPIICIVMFFNEKRKGLHDFVAGTIVVEKIE